ncbi:MAG: hypothetical protein KatS3mg030_196 [Saprospiraceae bacterium]|nr:MAG: hypothetical protein KatS3mg030_196 [Saprospiraceae bacterium]
MISSVIITSKDEAPRLRKLIERFCSDLLRIDAIFHYYAEAIPYLLGSQADCIFTETTLCGEDGFDCLAKLKFLDKEFVFMGDDAVQAIRSFNFSSADFLLRPISPVHLRRAATRITNKVKLKDQANSSTSNNKHQNVDMKKKKLMIRTQEGITLIDSNEVVRIEADRSYSIFHMVSGQRFIVSKPLRIWEELLQSEGFYRVHESHLINLLHIKQYLKKEGGAVICTNGDMIYVARRRKEGLLKMLQSMTLDPWEEKTDERYS